MKSKPNKYSYLASGCFLVCAVLNLIQMHTMMSILYGVLAITFGILGYTHKK